MLYNPIFYTHTHTHQMCVKLTKSFRLKCRKLGRTVSTDECSYFDRFSCSEWFLQRNKHTHKLSDDVHLKWFSEKRFEWNPKIQMNWKEIFAGAKKERQKKNNRKQSSTLVTIKWGTKICFVNVSDIKYCIMVTNVW